MTPQFETEKPRSPENPTKDASSDEFLTLEEAESLQKLIRSEIEEKLLNMPPAERKLFSIQKLSNIFADIKEGKKQAAEKFLQELATQEYWAKEEEWQESLAADLAKFVREHFSRKEIQEIRNRMRITDIERANYIPLGSEGIFAYEKIGNTAEIHLFEPRGSSGILLVLQLRRKFRIALENLARIARADRDIEVISVASWIVAEHPSAFKKFGFTFIGDEKDRDDLTQNIGVARMSREELLERYGKT